MAPTVANNFLKESNILLRNFSGEVTVDFLIEKWREDIDKGIVSNKLNGVISDLSETDLKFNIKDLRQIQAFYKENIEVFGSIKMAQVVDSPLIVYPKIFEKEESEFLSKAFSTVSAALSWMME